MDKLLSQEQYTTLNIQRPAFDSWIQVKYCRNLDRQWLQKMSGIYQKIFKAPPVDYNCNTCLGIALTRLYGKLIEYEAEQKRIQEEEKPDIKRKGRTPKECVKQ